MTPGLPTAQEFHAAGRYLIRVRGEARPERFDSATEATIWALRHVPEWAEWEWDFAT